MDASAFDRLSRALGRDAGRRSAMRALAASLLGVASLKTSTKAGATEKRTTIRISTVAPDFGGNLQQGPKAATSGSTPEKAPDTLKACKKNLTTCNRTLTTCSRNLAKAARACTCAQNGAYIFGQGEYFCWLVTDTYEDEAACIREVQGCARLAAACNQPAADACVRKHDYTWGGW
jgi:hypothetical protein